jgi:NAD(P)H-hydrate epimerase
VKADLVVSLHKKKVGFKNYRGEVKVADIGIPSFFEKISGPGDLRILSRAPSTHKGDNGRILIVGGGEYFGAPVLTAFAALRTGADIATLAVPERIAKIVSSFSPNLIVRKLSGDFLRMEHVPLIKKLLKKHDVLTIGMGLGEEGETKAAIPEILQERKKTVVDADALIKTKFQKGTILTPHAGEFMELYGKLPEGLSERMERVREISKKEGVVVLLKGVEDIISDGERVKINRTGNAGMTVGGSGDVLSGIVSALYALTSDPLRAASGGAFLSGVAGDLAYEEKRIGLLPTDIIEKIPYAIKKYC